MTIDFYLIVSLIYKFILKTTNYKYSFKLPFKN